MALADALGAVDPQAVVNDLIAQAQPDLAGSAVDPQSVVNRLIRKHTDEREQRARAPAAPAFSPSSFGRTEEDVANTPPFSSSQFGQSDEEKPPAAAPPPAPKAEWPGYLETAATAPLHHAVTQAGAQLKGLASNLSALTPSMVATGGGEGVPLEAEPLPMPDPRQNPLYKAGESVEKFGRETFPLSKTQQESITGRVTGGLGGLAGMAPGMVLGGVAGGAPGAIAAGAAQMGLSASGDTFSDAIEKGATPEEAAKAAGLSGLASGALGALPLGVILKPVAQVTPGLAGFAAARIEHALQTGIVFASIGEAQQYLAQEIARNFYDPKAEYAPDVKRVVASLLTGTIVGGALHRTQDPVQAFLDNARRTPAGGAEAAGGEGAGASRGPAWRQEIDEFLRAQEAAKQPGGPAGLPKPDGAAGAGGPSTFETTVEVNGEKRTAKGSYDPAEMARARSQADREGDFLIRAGYEPADIVRMSPDERGAALAQAAKDLGEPAPQPEGTRDAPVELKTAEDLARASEVINQDHSPEQGEANNVQRGHVVWPPATKGALDITLEAPAGGVRRGTAPNGEPFETRHAFAYGYLKGVPMGADGQAPDVTIGDHPGAPTAFVVDEVDPETGKFRQTKSFVGFQTPQAAIDAYLGMSSKDKSHFGGMRAFPSADFIATAKAGGLAKPVSDAMLAKEKQRSESVLPEEPGPDHHQAIDAALRSVGEHPHGVRPADLARAGEIHATEGAPPDQAFTVAVLRSLVEDGHITPDTLKQVIGDAAAQELLETGDGAQRGLRPASPRAAAGGAAPEEPGRLGAGGAEARAQPPRQAAAPSERAGSEGGAAAASHPAGGRSTPNHAASGIEAAGPAAGRASGSPGAGGGAAVAHGNAGAAEGALIGRPVAAIPQHAVTDASGTKVQVAPVVVEASHLITSSDQGYDKALQPRERERAASQAQIREIATRLDPERLGYSAEADRGAPIVGPDRMVESGNGRIHALRALYRAKAPNAERYRDWLKSQGVDVERYKEPILVRQRVSELATQFRTAKGSTYTLHEDGTTTRNKAERDEAGHEGDSGIKPRTERTVYVDDASLASALSAAGLQNLGPKGARVIIKDGKASLLTWNEKAGRWGRSANSTEIPVSDKPVVGKAPLELWKKADDVPGYDAYRRMHAGNAITEINADKRRGFTVAANQASTLAMSAPERALSDARRLTPDMLALIGDGSNLAAAENRPFMRAFVGSIPASERGSLANAEGALSAEGLTRAKNAVLAKAYGDADIISRITESTDDEIRSISNALTAAAPQWAKLKADMEAGRVARDLDLTGDLMEAVKRTADLRARGEKLNTYLAQNDAFDQLKGTVETFMRMFYNSQGRRAASAADIAEALRFVAGETAKVTTDPHLGLGLPEVSANDIQRAAIAKAALGKENDLGAGVDHGGEKTGRTGIAQGGPGEPGRGEEGNELERGFAESRKRFRPAGPDLFGHTERTAAGEQGVLPGAERISERELAERRGAKPLASKAEQKPADHGLFGERGQADLIEAAREKVSPAVASLTPAEWRGYEGRGGLAEGAAWRRPPADYVPFQADRRRPLGEQAQSFVIERGRLNGDEHLIAVDRAGRVTMTLRGTSDFIRIEEAQMRVLDDPASSIVIHHNHPSNAGLSSVDIGMLGRPGLAAIWAHGHGGNVARMALTPQAKEMFARLGTPEQVNRALFRVASGIEDSLYEPLQKAVLENRITIDEANQTSAHAVGLALAHGGIVDYRANTDVARIIESVGLEPYIRQAADGLKESFNVPIRDDRSADTLRHAGDVGAVFEPRAVVARENREQGRPARARPALDRTEAAGQIRLPGFAEDRSRFREPPQPGPGGAGPPPPPGATAPPPARRPTPTGVQRITHSTLARTFKRFWTSTFQPELFSDRALEADPLFARYKASSAQEKDAVVKQSESEWEYWNKRPDAERLPFLDAMERGATPADPAQANMARRYRVMLDRNWAEERRYGSQAAFVQDYFPHIWEQPEDFRSFSEARSAQVGPTWFQKKRTIDYINEGLAAGLKLKYTNPVDIVVHRLMSGVDMRQRMDLLHKLKDLGLAWEGAQGGEHLVRRGWRLINAPDRKQWVIAPDVQHLWNNAVQAEGLWQAEHVGGSMFRGWMALKNAWVPVKLALSAFHPLHVLHINYSNGLAQAWDDVVKGHDPVAALGAAARGFMGPLRAAPGASGGAVVGAALGAVTPIGPYWGALGGSVAGAITMGVGKRLGLRDLPHPGKAARAMWAKRPSQQTPEEKATVALMTDGGFVPQLSEQLKINAKRQMAEAFQKIARREAGASDWRRFVSAAMRRPIEKLQAPIFETWIPALKTAAYLEAATSLLRRRPELLDDDTERRIALRAIAKSIDNRYGEMFYGNLFWNRTLKDAGIGSFLSLGWNLGFVREFGGAAFEGATRPAGLIPPFRPGAGRKTIRDATNKIAFAIAYMGSFAIINGMMTYLFTGEKPEGLDYIFARVGGTNPEGSPRRITNMSYLREVPMLLKHVQERGGNWLTGAGEMLWNKLMFEPFHELLNNRDYFGYNIWDENAPLYKQIWQGVKHTFAGQTPMSVSGARHALDSGGNWKKDVPLSFMGFGPAPAYVEKSAIQNRIAYLFHQHVAPVSKPEEEGQTVPERMRVRSAILLAKQNKDQAALQEAFRKGKELGMKQDYMSKVGVTPTDMYLFSRLPNADQKAILNMASPEEARRYLPRAHLSVKIEFNRRASSPAH